MTEQIVSTQTITRTLYEVRDREGVSVWGGHDTHDAVAWLRRSPAGSTVWASLWDEDGSDDPWLIGSPIDVTALIVAALGTRW